MYSQAFADDPHGRYEMLRQRYGAMAPVEIAPGVPATLVLSHPLAVQILNDPDRFPADPRMWQATVPEDSPVLPMMRHRQAARYSTGGAHDRYRRACRECLDKVDLHDVIGTVETVADVLIDDFCVNGVADLVTQYAFPLVMRVLNDIVGCSPDLGQVIAAGMAARFDAVDADNRIQPVDAAEGTQMVNRALAELVASKRAEPGEDVTSWLLHHSERLDDNEVLANIMSFYAAGVEAQRNLVVNTILSMLTDDGLGGRLLGGSLSTRDALDAVLFHDPPMGNFCTTYPSRPVMIDDKWFPPHQPVLISLAACNNDPETMRHGDSHVGNRSHLAWSVGSHACPAKDLGYLVAKHSVDQLLDRLPDMELAVSTGDLRWRPGPFHRALSVLPVRWSV
ncbi:cytochrome P450 [Nocardia sp. NPDC003963]